MDDSVFLSKEKFSIIIENLVMTSKISYFDAIIEYAQELDKSPEELLEYMSTTLKQKVAQSAIDAGMIGREHIEDGIDFS